MRYTRRLLCRDCGTLRLYCLLVRAVRPPTSVEQRMPSAGCGRVLTLTATKLTLDLVAGENTNGHCARFYYHSI